jgi:2-polyprenyl-3-methyl-5-hydroxy-6-metoxy-1,4-benzoquinol methylase
MARDWWTNPYDPGRRTHDERYYLARHFVDGAVVDAACGYGTGAQILGDMATSVLAIDADEEGIATAQEYNKYDRITYLHADLYEVEIPPCDWVVTLETVEHLEDHWAFLHKIQRAARKGIVLSTPIVGSAPKPEQGHYHLFTRHDIEEFFLDCYWRQVFKGFPREQARGGLLPIYYLGVWKKRPQAKTVVVPVDYSKPLKARL